MRAYQIFVISIIAATMLVSPATSQTINYEPTWESLESRPYPKWFTDAKLGVFIHWGVYSVPAYSNKEDYGEWYLRGLMLGDSLRTSFMHTEFGENFEYKDFAPLFKAELFDPDEWAQIFKNAGAKYVVMVSKHHDGYALWPSKQAPNWNSMDVGPKRDLVGDLTQSVKNAGLRMGLYYSLPEWNNELHLWDTDDHRQIGNYVTKHMIPQFKDLISTYKPDVVFADGEWFNTAEEWHSAELISWYYNLVGPDAVVNNRWGSGSQEIGFLTPEYSSGIKETNRPWAEVRGLGRSFALNRFEKLDAYMTGEELIHFFVKAVSNGGGIIINVGPKADGQIPLLQQDRLIQLGKWLAINGQAIYGSTAWKTTDVEKAVFLERVDPNINFNWVRNSPGRPIQEDNFIAEWDGYISPEFSEEYHFEAQADDAVRLWVDDKLVIDSWQEAPSFSSGFAMGNTTEGTQNGRVMLKANEQHKIKITYFEKTQNASIRLYWTSDRQAKQIVPSSRFSTGLDKNTFGLNATYSSMRQYIGFTQNNGNLYAIAMDWPDDELAIKMEKPANETMVSLLGYEGSLPWKFQNGELIIDTSTVKHSLIESQHAWTFKIEDYN